MSTTKQPLGARTALTITGFTTLASATYAVSSSYDASANDPIDVVIEVEATTTNTPSGNKQVAVFAKVSLDGTNFSSGPESGTTTTAEPELYFLGVVPLPSASTQARRAFSVLAAIGFVPYAFKVIVKNDLGVALTAGACYTTEVTSTTV